MQVTKDIVRDLLPVYLAGEASSETRAAVEEWLAHDSALRELVDAAGVDSEAPPVEAPAGLEQQSLQRTRRLLAAKNLWLGSALVLTSGSAAVRPLWAADVVLVGGFAAWIFFLAACKKLAATGLEPPRRWSSRMMWAFSGILAGTAAGYLVQQQTGYHRAIVDLSCIASPAALWIGEKLHQIRTAEDLSRPTTLFSK